MTTYYHAHHTRRKPSKNDHNKNLLSMENRLQVNKIIQSGLKINSSPPPAHYHKLVEWNLNLHLLQFSQWALKWAHNFIQLKVSTNLMWANCPPARTRWRWRSRSDWRGRAWTDFSLSISDLWRASIENSSISPIRTSDGWNCEQSSYSTFFGLINVHLRCHTTVPSWLNPYRALLSPSDAFTFEFCALIKSFYFLAILRC